MGIKGKVLVRAIRGSLTRGTGEGRNELEGKQRKQAQVQDSLYSDGGGKEFLSDGFYFVTQMTQVKSHMTVCAEGGVSEV